MATAILDIESCDRVDNTGRRGRDGCSILDFVGLRHWKEEFTSSVKAKSRTKELFSEAENAGRTIAIILRDKDGFGKMLRPRTTRKAIIGDCGRFVQ
jgi:hypothetical protein